MTINPDELYLRTREELLQYEEARMNSLLQAMANFYSPRNDQSIWGQFFRAISMELARIEYGFAYDLVSKDPQYLTPPDIKRRWSDPLSVSHSYAQPNQFDSGDFSTASPAQEFPIGYRDMLVALLKAYREGATTKAISDVIFAYTGKNILVEELYLKIGEFFDESDRNAIKVSVNVGGDNPLTDIQNLNQLQQITSSLYGALDLAKPAHVGLELTTIFGTDENADCLLSPKYLTQTQLNTVSVQMQSYYTLSAYSLLTDSTSQITISAYNNLSSGNKALYEGLYLNSNCTGSGINDSLRILIQFVEEPAFNPMLIQAPILDPSNPNTTIAAYGTHFAPSLTSAQWSALPGKPAQAPVASPSLKQAYYYDTPHAAYLLGRGVWLSSNTHFYVGQRIIDSTGVVQIVTASTGATGATQPTWNTTLNGTTTDGSVTWRNLGIDTYSDPQKWIQVTNNGTVTGEVSNWDINHPTGLLAPRQDVVWEISGGDVFGSFEME
jgi:hypothetical protein